MYNAIYFYSTASGGSSTQNRFFGYTQKSAEKFLLFLAYLMILQSFSLPQACFTLKYQVFQIGKSEKKIPSSSLFVQPICWEVRVQTLHSQQSRICLEYFTGYQWWSEYLLSIFLKIYIYIWYYIFSKFYVYNRKNISVK